MGFDGIEFTENEYTTKENAHILKEACTEAGITPVAFCVGANFVKESAQELKKEIERVKGLCDVAAQMGVSMLRHDVAYGTFPRKYAIGYDNALPYFAEASREITVYAETLGIKTMTENHGFFSQDAVRVEKLINTAAHPNFGALVDVGNFMCADEDPVKSVGIMAPYAFHVHCKDFYLKSGNEIAPGKGWFCTRGGNYLRGCVIGFGEAKAAQSIRVLKNAGYDGYMTVEYEGGEDALWGIAVGLENIKRFLTL